MDNLESVKIGDRVRVKRLHDEFGTIIDSRADCRQDIEWLVEFDDKSIWPVWCYSPQVIK